MKVSRSEFLFPAANGMDDIVCRAWLCDQPRAIVQIVHGMSEHGGRYDDFAACLCAQGYAVYANDHAGHGKSAGFDFVIEDLAAVFRRAREDLGALPRVLIGHSMGSVLSALYADRGNGLEALALMGLPKKYPALGLWIAIADRTAERRGFLARSLLLEKLTGSTKELSGKALEEKEKWLSGDLEQVRRFIADEACGFDYTASGYAEMMRGFQAFYHPSWGEKIPDIPILVLGGSRDSAGSFGKAQRRCREQLTNSGHTRVTEIQYPKSRHELLNDVERKAVLTDILAWLGRTVCDK